MPTIHILRNDIVRRAIAEALRSGTNYEAYTVTKDSPNWTTCVHVEIRNRNLNLIFDPPIVGRSSPRFLTVNDWRCEYVEDGQRSRFDPLDHSLSPGDPHRRYVFDTVACLLGLDWLQLFLKINANQISGCVASLSLYDNLLPAGGFFVSIHHGRTEWTTPVGLVYRQDRNAAFEVQPVIDEVILPSQFTNMTPSPFTWLNNFRQKGIRVRFGFTLFPPAVTSYSDIEVTTCD